MSKRSRIGSLRECVKVQRSDGNWNYDSYMLGMANGMILSLAIIEGKTPKYLSAPDAWLKDLPTDSHAEPCIQAEST